MYKRSVVRLCCNRDGSAMVEMAAILPFLLVLGCGVFEFGAFFVQPGGERFGGHEALV